MRCPGTDCVDLYQIRRFDYGAPIKETLEALHDVVKAGKVRYIGASWMLLGSSPAPSASPTTAAESGATRLHHLDDATAVGVMLSAEEIATLEEPYVSRTLVGFE